MQEKNIRIKLPILDGSVSTATAKCGNKNCGCQKDKKKWHGPYYRWTGKIGEKRTTVTLSEDQAKECEKWIASCRDLLLQIETLLKKTKNDAPWK